MRKLWSIFLCPAIACSPGDGVPDDNGAPVAEVLEESQAEIASEQPGIADIMGEVDANCNAGWCGYFEDPNQTFLSYAVVKIGGCTGTFIGPNIVMTASHCGGPSLGATAIHYLRTAAGRPGGTLSSYNLGNCQMLLGAIQQNHTTEYRGATDVALFFCPDINVRGTMTPPGLLLGDLDFDTREVSVGEPVVRFWSNLVVNRGQTHMLVGQGNIQNTSGFYGYQNAEAYNDNTCVNEGGSGSPGISRLYQRILMGPLDSGGGVEAGPCGVGTRATKAHAIFSEFYLDQAYGAVQLNSANIQNLTGLRPELYFGHQDKDANNVLDIVEHIDAVRGEPLRDYYWYHWDSARRNAQWSALANTVFYTDHVAAPAQPYGIVRLSAPNSQQMLKHEGFKFEPNRRYRMSVQLSQVGELGAGNLSTNIFLTGRSIQNAGSIPAVSASLPQFAAPLRHTLGFWTNGTGLPGLRLTGQGALAANLQTMVIMRDGAVLNFDTVDKRQGWKNQNTNARALFVPDGISSAVNAAPDFALAIRRDPARVLGSDWPAYYDYLPLTPGDRYQLCFSVKSSAAVNLSGRVEVMSHNNTLLSAQTFPVSGVWTERCLNPFTMVSVAEGAAPTASRTRAQIRFQLQSSSTEHILVDNLRVNENP